MDLKIKRKKSKVEKEEQSNLFNLSNCFSNFPTIPLVVKPSEPKKNIFLEDSISNHDKEFNIANINSNHTNNNDIYEESVSNHEEQSFITNNINNSDKNTEENFNTDGESQEEIQDDNDYYHDSDVDVYSQVEDDIIYQTDSRNTDSINNNFDSVLSLPFSRLNGFNITQVFSHVKSVNELNKIVDQNNTPLYEHEGCVMTRGIILL
jgi:hypothetical protein